MAGRPTPVKGAELVRKSGTLKSVDRLSEIVTKLDQQREELAEAGDYEALAVQASMADYLARQLKTYTDSARVDIGRIVRFDRRIRGSVSVDGLSEPLTIEGGTDVRCVDPKGFLVHLVKGMFVDHETGEFDVDGWRVAETVLGIVMDCVSIGEKSFRLTMIREYLPEIEGEERPEGDWFERTDKPPKARLSGFRREAFDG